MDSTIKLELLGFLEKLGVSKSAISDDMNLFAEGVIDSMQAIDYLVMIEEKFNVNVTMQIVIEKKLGCPSYMAKYIETLIQ